MEDLAEQSSLHQNSCLPLLFFSLLFCESFIQKYNFLIETFATVNTLASVLDANRIKDTKGNEFSFFFSSVAD